MKLRTLGLPLALALLAGCTPYTVKFDYDSHANYTAYKTWDWYAAGAKDKGKAAGIENPIMDRRVRGAVERELNTKGMKQEKGAEPDLLVTYYPHYHTGTVYHTTSIGGFGPWRPWGFGMGTHFTDARSYREGTIVLEIVDNKTNTLIWQAAAEGALTGLDDPLDAEEQVTSAVKSMLSRFPPPVR